MDTEIHDRLADVPLVRLLSIAGHVVGQRRSRLTSQQHGLTTAGVSVLVALGGGPPDTGRRGRATHRDLARRCWITPATLTGIVDTLERAGLVERVRDPDDRRQVWITLTRAGARRLREIGDEIRHAFAPTVAERDPAKAAAVREYLTELIATYHEGDG